MMAYEKPIAEVISVTPAEQMMGDGISDELVEDWDL